MSKNTNSKANSKNNNSSLKNTNTNSKKTDSKMDSKNTQSKRKEDLNPRKEKGGSIATALTEGVSLNYRQKKPYVERMTQVFAFIMLALYALTIGDQYYVNITEVKYMWFKWLTIIACGAILVIFVVGLLDNTIRIPREKEGNEKFNLAMIISIVYLVWATISTLASEYELSELFVGVGRYEGLLSLILYTLIFIIISLWGEYTDIYVYGISGMAIIFGLFAMIQLGGGSLFYPEGYSYWDVHFLSTIGNVDCVSGIAALFVPAMISGFVFLEGKGRFACLPGIFFMSYAFFAGDADSGKMGMLAAFVVCFVFLFDTREHTKDTMLALAPFTLSLFIYKVYTPAQEGAEFAFGKMAGASLAATVILVAGYFILEKTGWWFKWDAKMMRKVLAIALLVVIVAGLIFVFTYNGNIQLLTEAHDILHGNMSDDAGSGRGYCWKMSVELIKEQPLLGGGRGSFGNRFYPYNQWYWDHGSNIVFDFAHNDLLQIGVETGLVGLLIYITLIGTLAVTALKTAARYPKALIFLSGIVGCLGHLFFSFSIAIVTPIMWAMMGCLNKFIKQVPRVQAPKAEKEKQEA